MPNFNRPGLGRFCERLCTRSVLSPEERAAVLSLPGHVAQVRANRDFVRLGERVEHACLILEGLVGRFDQTSDGGRQFTALHLPGDMADLHSFVQPQAASALHALSAATILRVPHSALRAATGRYPGLAEAFWRDCTLDASILSQWLVNLGRRDAKSRLAHLLCETAMRLDAPIEAGAFTFPFAMTQAHLADATGLTNVHVNRVIKVLREDRLAEISARQVRVWDWNALVRAADFDPAYLQMRIPPGGMLRIV